MRRFFFAMVAIALLAGCGTKDQEPVAPGAESHPAALSVTANTGYMDWRCDSIVVSGTFDADTADGVVFQLSPFVSKLADMWLISPGLYGYHAAVPQPASAPYGTQGRSSYSAEVYWWLGTVYTRVFWEQGSKHFSCDPQFSTVHDSTWATCDSLKALLTVHVTKFSGFFSPAVVFTCGSWQAVPTATTWLTWENGLAVYKIRAAQPQPTPRIANGSTVTTYFNAQYIDENFATQPVPWPGGGLPTATTTVDVHGCNGGGHGDPHENRPIISGPDSTSS